MKRFVVFVFMFVLCAHPLTAQQARSGIKATDQGVLMDVQDAVLKIVIAALAEAGGINVVYNDLPQKRVTMRLNDPIPRAGVTALLKNIVESAGLVCRDEASIIRIVVPEVQAPPPVQPPAATNG